MPTNRKKKNEGFSSVYVRNEPYGVKPVIHYNLIDTMFYAYIYIHSTDFLVSRNEIEYLESALKDQCDKILHRWVGTMYFIGREKDEAVYIQNMINRGLFRDVKTIVVPYTVCGRRIDYRNAYRIFQENGINIRIYVAKPEE